MNELDNYFKEQIDNEDAFNVMIDENGFLDTMIAKRDIIDAIDADMASDDIVDDEGIFLATMSSDDLDDLVDDNEYNELYY